MKQAVFRDLLIYLCVLYPVRSFVTPIFLDFRCSVAGKILSRVKLYLLIHNFKVTCVKVILFETIIYGSIYTCLWTSGSTGLNIQCFTLLWAFTFIGFPISNLDITSDRLEASSDFLTPLYKLSFWFAMGEKQPFFFIVSDGWEPGLSA